jgi:hypothetical protein
MGAMLMLPIVFLYGSTSYCSTFSRSANPSVQKVTTLNKLSKMGNVGMPKAGLLSYVMHIRGQEMPLIAPPICSGILRGIARLGLVDFF